MSIFTDQVGRNISLSAIPQRIVSLVPSQTELLVDLGLERQLVGITKFCVHPERLRVEKKIVGGTKKVSLESIRAVRPDLIIANKEENTREDIEALEREFPVWISDVSNLESAVAMIRDIGYICHREVVATDMAYRIEQLFSELSPPNAFLRGVYLIWADPYMTVGGDTFINAMLRAAGFENPFSSQVRYPIISMEDLVRSNIDCLLLSSEPFPFHEKHRQYFQQHMPNTKICLVDGEMFSWYGSRLLQAPAYFRKLQQSQAGTHAC